MTYLKNIALLIYGNTLGLPLGVKMLFSAAAIAVTAQFFGLASQFSWAIALFIVIVVTCSMIKFPTLIGKSK